jgi:phytanoyl-CoA hydroxylase
MLGQAASQWINRLSLDKSKLAFWEANGYVVLPELFSKEETAAVKKLVETVFKNKVGNFKTVIDIYINRGYRRVHLNDCPDDAELETFKLNDLFLEHDLIRQVALNPTLTKYLREFLHGDPMLCNSLNFNYSSQQDFHTDSLYMTPPKDLNLAAAWIALEDCHPDSGPLEYYPGSNLIPPYLFSNGAMSSIQEEMEQYIDYMHNEIAKRNLKVEQFLPKEGDCLIWHSQLFHAGGKINNPQLTRKSLVAHYFRNGDYSCNSVNHSNNTYWMDRNPQEVR